MRCPILFFCLLPTFLFASHARATLITTNVLNNPATIDFIEFQTNPINESPGPIQIGLSVGENIEFTGGPNASLYTSSGGWGLGSNGRWNSGRFGFLANNDQSSHEGTSIRITFFDDPVAGIGAFMNHCPNCGSGNQTDLILSVFNVSDVLLETYNVTALAEIVTPGAVNDGAFRGIQRDQADIFYFEVSGYVPVMDDLAFTRLSPIPEPNTAALLGIGLFGLAAAKRSRKLDTI